VKEELTNVMTQSVIMIKKEIHTFKTDENDRLAQIERLNEQHMELEADHLDDIEAKKDAQLRI
jgi:hypothetical protein